MSHDTLRLAIVASALASGVLLVGCGDFSADPVGQAGGAGTPAAGSPGASGSGGSSMGGDGSGGAAAGTGGAAAGTSGGGAGPRPDPPKAMCTDVTACGGDVAGVWFASSSCLPISGKADIGNFGLGCKEVDAEGKLEVTGNWTLDADGSISDNTTTTGTVKMELEPACMDISGTVTQCNRVPAQLDSLGLKEPECVDSTIMPGGCTCTGKIEQMGSMAHVVFDTLKTGKYELAANKLTTKGIDSVEYDYCVQGDVMIVTPKVPKDIGQLNGTVVFQKQQ